jgi:DNA invertase Pin-like site-specific DNA recombinase
MNVGLYTRVSTETQVRGESLEDQEHDGHEWAERRRHHVVRVFTDAGLSGKLAADERPGLAAALEALEAGVIDGLVVRDLDRLARELTVQEAVLAQVWTRDDTIVFEYGRDAEVLRDDPDDPMRTTIRQVMGAFKELDRKLVAKRLRDGRRSKARKGKHANGPAPYGWVTRDGELWPVASELEVLDLMRELRASGARQADIAEALNAAGHPARSGGAWTQPVVSRILARDAARTPEQRAYHASRLGALVPEALSA